MSDKIKLNGQNGKGDDARVTNWRNFRQGYDRIFKPKKAKEFLKEKP